MIRLKCMVCKKFLTDKEIEAGGCFNCDATIVDFKELFLAVCPECGKKLEGNALRNAIRTCCPYCMTVIEL